MRDFRLAINNFKNSLYEQIVVYIVPILDWITLKIKKFRGKNYENTKD